MVLTIFLLDLVLSLEDPDVLLNLFPGLFSILFNAQNIDKRGSQGGCCDIENMLKQCSG